MEQKINKCRAMSDGNSKKTGVTGRRDAGVGGGGILL